MPKLLRTRKQFGRCSVEGHGQNLYCECMADIQETPFTRAQDKREGQQEIDDGVFELAHDVYVEEMEGILCLMNTKVL